MRIIKREDGWWIIDVPSSADGGERFTDCGPYATKADAAEDQLGLERFFVEHPVCDPHLPGIPEPSYLPLNRPAHWLAKSLQFKPSRLSKPKPRKDSPRQMTLPGFDLS